MYNELHKNVCDVKVLMGELMRLGGFCVEVAECVCSQGLLRPALCFLLIKDRLKQRRSERPELCPETVMCYVCL